MSQVIREQESRRGSEHGASRPSRPKATSSQAPRNKEREKERKKAEKKKKRTEKRKQNLLRKKTEIVKHTFQIGIGRNSRKFFFYCEIVKLIVFPRGSFQENSSDLIRENKTPKLKYFWL